jgi:hypothetical protein
MDRFKNEQDTMPQFERSRGAWLVAALLGACSASVGPGASGGALNGDGGRSSIESGGGTGGRLDGSGGYQAAGVGGTAGTGGERVASGGDGTPSGGNGTAPGETGGTDSGGEASGSGGNASLAMCVASCQGPGDCVVGAGTAISDADNYRCESGGCRYLGCLTDQECESALPGNVCRQGSCVKTCLSPADCSLGISAYDADNYECKNAACNYLGCRSDQECEQGLSADYVCSPVFGSVPACQAKLSSTCSGPADCVIQDAGQAYDEDNYRCDAGTCTYKGCLNDAECSAASPGSICRAF